MVLMGGPFLPGKVKGMLGHYEFWWVISPQQAPLPLWDENDFISVLIFCFR